MYKYCRQTATISIKLVRINLESTLLGVNPGLVRLVPPLGNLTQTALKASRLSRGPRGQT
jgi:hypothetical protein